ncbi:MAG: hypothetical protein KBC53_04055 [Nitrosomonas sp.]|nr:hypothetical protein [Nitrosomonas sp.]
MYAAIIKFLAPYAMKIAAGLIITLIVIGGYFYWKHQIVSDALEVERAAWVKRDAETEKKGQALLDLKNHEIERVKEEQRNTFIGAIQDYAKHYKNANDQLAADRNKRLFVNTAASSCGGNTLSAKAGGSTGAGGAGAKILQAELEPETAETIRANAAEVETGARLCEILIERFLIPDSVLK